LIFATKPGLFSIGTIVVLTFVWPNQPAKLITLTCLNSIEYVYVHVEPMSILPISSNIHVEPIFVLPIKINIPLHTFKQHLLKSFFQLEVEEMEIDETPVHIRVQNLHIVGWIVTKEEQLIKINLGSKENLQHVKINVDLELVVNYQVIELLKEFKNIFAWTYKDLKGIPPKIA
jgi:hypothetical protein